MIKLEEKKKLKWMCNARLIVQFTFPPGDQGGHPVATGKVAQAQVLLPFTRLSLLKPMLTSRTPSCTCWWDSHPTLWWTWSAYVGSDSPGSQVGWCGFCGWPVGADLAGSGLLPFSTCKVHSRAFRCSSTRHCLASSCCRSRCGPSLVLQPHQLLNYLPLMSDWCWKSGRKVFWATSWLKSAGWVQVECGELHIALVVN